MIPPVSPRPRLTPLSIWRNLTRGARALGNASERDRDISDEVDHYVAEAAAAGVARGLGRDEALRVARIEIGGTTVVHERVRISGWEHRVETFLADLRFGVRRLRADPGFTAVALITLALGVGGTTAVFSAVKPVLFDPLPYPDAARITAIWEQRRDGVRNDGTFGMYRALAERSRTFASLAVLRSWQPTLSGAEHPERLDAQRVSWRYFQVLGVQPALGRGFTESDDQPGAPGVVLISDALWRTRFDGDRHIVGRTISLDQTNYSVAGVMPASFQNVLEPGSVLWAPLQYDMSDGRAWGHHLRTVGRMQPNTDAEIARRELDALGNSLLSEQRPETYGKDVLFSVLPLREDVVHDAKPARLAILGAMFLVLVITCVNVTNLLIARGVRRRAEFALRAALGAARRRLVRQLLTESLLLAALGGVLGLTIAAAAGKGIDAIAPASVVRAGAIDIDMTVFVFALLLTVVVGVAFGAIPARQAGRSDPHRELRIGTSRAVGGQRRTRSMLVAAEVALALILLVSSGLLLRSLQRLFSVDAGFDATRVLTMQIQTTGPRFRDDDVTRQYFDAVVDAVGRVPGLDIAGVTSQLPLTGESDRFGVRFEHGPPPRDIEDPSAFRYNVSPEYISAMRIPLRRGRLLAASDRRGAPLVALISASYAARVFSGRDPIRERLSVGGRADWITIIGVVGDVRQASLSTEPGDGVYLPISQSESSDRVMSLVVRATSRDGTNSSTMNDATALASAVREAVWSVDPNQAVARVATMAELVATSTAERRFTLVLFELFALAALVLAAAGIYGVIAGSVAERTREFGVRTALGASRRQILSLVFRDGLGVTAIGVAVGLLGAAWAGRSIATMLYGISPLDVPTYAGVLALLVAMAALASAVPAWRAARLDPALTLRGE
ncbi:MAG: ABC transporter permease [Gemmatimonadaceae bacterium]